jgi:hypothetical protein
MIDLSTALNVFLGLFGIHLGVGAGGGVHAGVH